MISFIIPAHNEQALIGAMLSALREAADHAGEPYEVIVVADSCTDATPEIARKAGVRVVDVALRQIAGTRNAGAREAQGDVYFFVDADTLANAGAIRSALQELRAGAAGGGCIPRFDGRLPLWARLLSLLVVAAGRTFNLVGGCFLFCTREAFESIGGFCEEYYAAEEAAFITALKRHGRFVVPLDRVVTSGRKLRTHSAWEIGRQLWRLAWRGPKSFRSRDGLEVWYGEPRTDPECIGPAQSTTVKEPSCSAGS
jgi:glycosyltransferase involved in cell wall biosynthesis